ncbi:MAG TPA: creatininase family protein [Gemmatimonadales bacterium]|nr:creatininase family protein [Gemmatimonadales bacterium]
MTMRPLRLADMTWEEVRDLEETASLAILPIGAIEAHGPHLPLATDGLIAEAMAQAGAERLARRGYGCLLLPCLHYTAAPFAAEFPGTLSVGPGTVTAMVADLARGVARFGLDLALANVHLDPAHLAALGAAAATTEGRVIFPNITKRPWAPRLTEEFQSGACHAGQYESSVILAQCPELVRNEIRRSLAPNPASLSQAIREGKHTFGEAGGPRAYFGNPAHASTEEGRRVIDILGGILEDAVVATHAEPDRT